MELGQWDALEADLAEAVYARGEPVGLAVCGVCSAHGKAAVELLVFALASLASALEDEWRSGPLSEQRRLIEAYRACAALAVDLAAARQMAFDVATCEDLLRYWLASGDEHFLPAGPG